MRIQRIAMLLLAGLCAAAGVAQSQDPPPYPGGDQAGQPSPDAGQAGDPAAAGIDYFHDQLSPYGQWVIRPGYGQVWVPSVAVGWRPYTTGHWAYTDQGWAWVADEHWGWAPFHYGRWYYDQEIGWGWVPGYTWAPSWVSWRHGGGYLGWAPLPPTVGWTVGVGLAFGAVTIGAGYYTFCGMHDIFAPRLGGFIVPSARSAVFINQTTVINNYTVVGGHVVNGGFGGAALEREYGRPVPRVAIVGTSSLGGGAVGGGRLGFYQPPVIARAARAMPAEFGHALGNQVAVQAHSRSFVALRGTPAGAGHLQGGVQGAGFHPSGVTRASGGGGPASAGTPGVHHFSTPSTVHSTGAGTSTAHGTGTNLGTVHHTTGAGTSSTHHATATGVGTTGGTTKSNTATSTGTSHATGTTGSGHSPSTGAGTSGGHPPSTGAGTSGGHPPSGSSTPHTESGGKPHKPPGR